MIPFKEWMGLAHRTDANAGLPQQGYMLRTAANLLTDGDLPDYDAALVDLLRDLDVFSQDYERREMLAILDGHKVRPPVEVEVRATVCTKDHGGPNNGATFYGHPGDSGVCVRVGDTWVNNATMTLIGEEE